MNYDELEQQIPGLKSVMQEDPQIEILSGTFPNGGTLRYIEYLDDHKRPAVKSQATQALVVERDDTQTVVYKGIKPLRDE